MKYYSLNGDDAAGTYAVLSMHDDNGRVVTRPEYRGMECRNCGKIDEEAAVARCIPSDLRVSSNRDARRDAILTVDEFLVVSRRFARVMETEGVSGAKLLALPGDDRFMLFIPQRVPGRFELSGLEAKFPTDLEAFATALVAARRSQQPSVGQGPVRSASTTGDPIEMIKKFPELRLKGTADHRCVMCGRHFATYGTICSASVTPPTDPLRFFTPSFNHESRGGNRFEVLCSEVLARLLLRHKLSGFRLFEMDTKKRLGRRGKLS